MEYYFADRKSNILGVGSTDGKGEWRIDNDIEKQSVDNRPAVELSLDIHFTTDQEQAVNEMAKATNFILYQDEEGNGHQMVIESVEHDSLGHIHSIVASDAGNDLINETVGAFKAEKPYTIADYITRFTNDSGWEIGINEFPDNVRTLEWTSEESSLARIIAVAKDFDAVLSFGFEFVGTNLVKRVINIRHETAGDSLISFEMNKDINNIVTHLDTYDMETSIKAYGAVPESTDGSTNQDPINLIGYNWTDPTGQFVLDQYGFLHDTIAVQKYSRLLSNSNPSPTQSDWNRVKTFDSKSQAALLQAALADLKKYNHPNETYDIDLVNSPYVPLNQTVHIADENQQLFLSAKVLSIQRSRANHSVKLTLGEFVHDTVSFDERLSELANQMSNISKTIQYYPWLRYADDDKGTNMSAFPTGKKYMAIVWSNETSVPSDNPSDYAGHWALIQGKDGADGVPGANGADGRTSYFHTAWANDVSGQSGFTVSGGDGKKYIGTYSDFTLADSTNPADYNWALFKGADGDVGPKGDQGFPGTKGADGRTAYAHFAYANSQDGNTDFSTTDSNRKYIGFYSDFSSGDSTNPSVYNWSLIKGTDGADGKDGVPGKAGADGKTSYFHIAYADSSDGRTNFSLDTPGSRKYIGSYTDFTQADSNNPAVYSWQLVQGPKGDTGVGIPGPKGADGRTSYFHTAWSNSADGTLDFNPDYKSAVGLDILNVTSWAKNTSMSNSTYKFVSNADSSFKVTGKGTGGYEVLSKSFPAKVGDKLRFTVRYTNRLSFELYNGYGLQFVVNNEYTESVTSTSKIVLPNAITMSTEYQLEYTATTNNVWMQLNFGGVADSSQVDFDVKIEVENLTNPVKYTYMGTYSDFTSGDSTNPSDYSWSLIKGADGADGKDGVPGKAGADGKTPYFHIAYADSSDGKTNFSLDTPGSRKYIGSYTDFTQADSTNPALYSWQLVQGPKGDKGESVKTIKVTSAAYQLNPNPLPGVWIGGEEVPGISTGSHYNNWGRGHNLVVINKDTFQAETVNTYDDYATPAMADTLAKDITALVDKVVIVFAIDASSITTALRNALNACGGNPDISLYNAQRASHIFIGMSKDSTGKYPLALRQGYEVLDTSDSANRTLYAAQSGFGIAANGASGKDGVAGKDGLGIKSTQIMYAQSTSGTTAPTTGWTAQVPTLIKGQYMWTQTTWLYTDNTGEAGYTVSYNAKDGNTGANGIAGKDGVGIKRTVIEYAVSSNGVTNPTTGWSATIPSIAPGQFMWTRTTWLYTDGTNEVGYSVAQAGATGPKGDPGPQGVPGSKDVPYTYIQLGTPASPKKGDLWWHGKTLNDATALQYYNGSTWIDQSIQQAVLSIKKLQSIEVDTSTINSPDINSPFNHVRIDGAKSSGNLQLNDANLSILGNIEDNNGNPNGQYYKSLLSPNGMFNYITTPDQKGNMSSVALQRGALQLQTLISDPSAATKKYIQSEFTSKDNVTFFYVNTTALRNIDIDYAYIYYTRRGNLVTVNFQIHTIANQYNYLRLADIRPGYKPLLTNNIVASCLSFSDPGQSTAMYSSTPSGGTVGWYSNISKASGSYGGSVSYLTQDDYPTGDSFFG